MTTAGAPRSHPSLYAGQRFLVVVLVGAVVAVVTALLAPWQATGLIGWDAAAVTFVVWTYVIIRPMDARQTAAAATREDDSRFAVHVLLVAAAVGSLAGIAVDLSKSTESSGTTKALFTALAVITVALSWAVVHLLFTLRYAHEYYTDPVGGVDFKTANYEPDYHDFLYVGFTVGMTFQVSDTDIQSQQIRRTVLRHALLSFLFGAVILAVTVNVVASIAQ